VEVHLEVRPWALPQPESPAGRGFRLAERKDATQRRTGWRVSIHRMAKGPGKDPAGEP
ncbi:MAG: hypothetical protein RLZZ627_828, partial [Pseudomonadota bacterium]